MTVEIIAIARKRGLPVELPAAVAVMAGRGIVGDRHFTPQRSPGGGHVSLIEAEVVEAFNRKHAMAIHPADTRRNLVTRGVRLNGLVGKVFTIGNVRLRGVEWCEPCESLGSRLARKHMPMAKVVRAFVHRGGLRAEVLAGGMVRLGDVLQVQG